LPVWLVKTCLSWCKVSVHYNLSNCNSAHDVYHSLPFQVSSLIALCRLMVKWKRAELRHRARLARDKQDWEKQIMLDVLARNGRLLLLFLLVMNYNSYSWHSTWENRFGICTIVFSVVYVLWCGDVISIKSTQFVNLAFMEQTQQASSQEKPQMLLWPCLDPLANG
jgi:hypothetical protein